jgi:hypothetical protein
MSLDKITLITEVTNELEGIVRGKFKHIKNDHLALYANRQAKAASFLIESFKDYEPVIGKVSVFASQAREEVKLFGYEGEPHAFSTVVRVLGNDYPFTLEVEIGFGSGVRHHVTDPESDFSKVTNTIRENAIETIEKKFPGVKRIEPCGIPNSVGKGCNVLIEHGNQNGFDLAASCIISSLDSIEKEGERPLFYGVGVTADGVDLPFRAIVSLIFSFAPESSTTSEEQNAN